MRFRGYFFCPHLPSALLCRRHFSQSRSTRSVEFRFEELFDGEALNQYVSALSLENLLECGWDGVLDKVVEFGHFEDRFVNWHSTIAGLKPPEPSSWIKISGHKKVCKNLQQWATEKFDDSKEKYSNSNKNISTATATTRSSSLFFELQF